MRCAPAVALWMITVGAHAAAPDAVLPLVPYQEHQLALRAEVAGKPGMFLFDTGEGMTMITPTLASAIGCTPWGNVTAMRMLGERLDTPRCDGVRLTIADQALMADEAIVYDLANIAGKDAPVLQGAIGLDVFAGRMLTIAMARHQLVLENAGSLADRIGGAHAAQPVPMRIVRAIDGASLEVFLGIRTARGIAWMELDTGNAGPTIFVSRAIAPLLHLDAADHPPRDAKPQRVTLALAPGVAFTGLARVFPNMVEDGNIGLQVLKGWDLTLDLANGKAWMAPAAAP